MNETFKLISGQRMIEIGDHGTVRKVNGFIYAPNRQLYIMKNGKRKTMGVHRVMWEEFVGPIGRNEIVVFKNGDQTDLRIENLEKIKRPQYGSTNNGIYGRVGISMRGDGRFLVKRDGKYIGIALSKEEAIEMWEKNENKAERRIREYNEKYKK